MDMRQQAVLQMLLTEYWMKIFFESVDMPIEKNVSDVVQWMKEYVEKK